MSDRLQKMIKEAAEYPCFTVYPFYHDNDKMPWAGAVEVHMDKVERLIWCGGHTGRDPKTDRQPRNWEEERRGVGKVVGGVKEQTTAAWTRIKEILESMGASLEDIFHVDIFLVNREDWWDMWQAYHDFYVKNCPGLAEHPRAGVLLKYAKLDLPDMLVEIEVIAAVPKRRPATKARLKAPGRGG
ncbi:MAG: RidA family protein [Chloroflexi bacterium]|nr:RidA family protein [Chloroflexota bacterium]